MKVYISESGIGGENERHNLEIERDRADFATGDER